MMEIDRSHILNNYRYVPVQPVPLSSVTFCFTRDGLVAFKRLDRQTQSYTMGYEPAQSLSRLSQSVKKAKFVRREMERSGPYLSERSSGRFGTGRSRRVAVGPTYHHILGRS